MDISVAGAHWPQYRTKVGSDGIEDVGAEGQTPRGIADQGGENIARAQRVTDRRAQSFLAFAKEDAAVNLAGAIEGGKLFVQHARQKHRAEGIGVSIADGR